MRVIDVLKKKGQDVKKFLEEREKKIQVQEQKRRTDLLLEAEKARHEAKQLRETERAREDIRKAKELKRKVHPTFGDKVSKFCEGFDNKAFSDKHVTPDFGLEKAFGGGSKKKDDYKVLPF